jgi:hypothetical protein
VSISVRIALTSNEHAELQPRVLSLAPPSVVV